MEFLAVWREYPTSRPSLVQDLAPLWAPGVQKTVHVSSHAVPRLLAPVPGCSYLQCRTDYAAETGLHGIS